MNFNHGRCFISVTMATIFCSNTFFCQDVEPNNILMVEFIVIKDRHKKLNLVWTPLSMSQGEGKRVKLAVVAVTDSFRFVHNIFRATYV